MKYLIRATIRKGKGDFCNAEIPTEIIVENERAWCVFTLDGKEWWIPVPELDHLMAIVNDLI